MTEALATHRPPDPSVPVGRGWVAGLALANLAAFVAFFGPLQVLLAQQAQEVAPGQKEAALGLVTGVGAFVSLVCNPLFGALSDRTRSRFGRRRPWVAMGALAGAAGLAVLSGVHTVAWMVLGWALVQAAVNASYAAVMASIPDQVPRRQRGSVGGWVALAQTLGAMVGVGLAAATGGWAAGYLACAVFLLLMSAPFVLGSHDPPVTGAPRAPLRLKEFARDFWVSPKDHPDFAWAWVTRFLVHVGNALGLVYLYYFLQDAVGYDDPEGGVFVLTVTYAVCSVLTTVFAGKLSDRLGRRKVFVSVSGVVMAVATAMLALLPVWPVAVVGAAVLGLGFGVFMAVDYALLTEVLPAAADVGRDLGVINIAAALPQVLAPAVAAPLVASAGGYPALYLLAAAMVFLGAVLVGRIRGVA
jgi:MFS family permease